MLSRYISIHHQLSWKRSNELLSFTKPGVREEPILVFDRGGHRYFLENVKELMDFKLTVFMAADFFWSFVTANDIKVAERWIKENKK